MNEARVYADGFERSFAEVKDLLEFLAERGRNAKWIRKPTNTLRLAPLEKEAQNLDAADASMEEILEDTEKNTQLVRKRLNFRHGYKNPRPHFCNRSTLIIHI